jgi:hypothetical protein
MHLIKSRAGQTIVFDDGEVFILNSPSIMKEQRLFTALFIVSIAIAGIIMNLSGETLLSLIAFIALLIYGIVYFSIYFITKRRKIPDQLKYSDITGIDFISLKKASILKLKYENNSKSFEIRTSPLDAKLIKFLEDKNLLSHSGK